VLRREGIALPLGSRALDILIYLAERPGEVIAKQALIDHVWSDVTVEEGSLRVHVAAIRKALGDGQFGNRYIANIKGRGYSFVGAVVPLTGNTGGTVVGEVGDKLRDERSVTLLGPNGDSRRPSPWLLAAPQPRSLADKSILLTWEALPIRAMLRGLSRHPWDLH
jgi:hypothetical protein